jgi:hypothetical protein
MNTADFKERIARIVKANGVADCTAALRRRKSVVRTKRDRGYFPPKQRLDRARKSD